MNQVKPVFHGGNSWNAINYQIEKINLIGNNIIPADVLDAWYQPAPAVLRTLHEYLDLMVHTCPPAQPASLIQTIAKARNLSEKNICSGSGASQLIFALLQMLVQANDTAVIMDPMYGEYRHVLENVIGCKVLPYLLEPSNNFKISFPDLASFITKHKPRAVIIVNPNSPTSTYVTKDKIQELLLTTPASTLIFLDETYIEYTGSNESCEKLVKNNPRLCVLKSMSKIYALSGLRVGYTVAHESIISRIIANIPPWSVSLPAQLAAIKALEESQYYAQKIFKTKKLRDEFESQLKTIPALTAYPGIANFILCRIDKKRISASALIERLTQKNIFIRNCDSMSTQFKDDYIRITVRDASSNQKITKALKSIISPERG